MFRDRIRYAPLLDKIKEAHEAAAHIKDGTNLFISGFAAGYPKEVPKELAKRAAGGEEFKINIFAGASTGEELDGLLAKAGIVGMRRPYMGDRAMRKMINNNEIHFKDDHLSQLSQMVRAGECGNVDMALVEAAAITEQGNIIPTLSVGNTPSYVQKADKIIIEMSGEDPPSLEGIHDIYIPEDPPYRMPIPIYRTSDRVGKPFIDLDPSRVVGVVFSKSSEGYHHFSEPGEVPKSIARRILDFVRHEIQKGRLPKGLPWQGGVGDVANAVLSQFADDDFFQEMDLYSEVLPDSVLDLIDRGKMRCASGSAVTFSQKARERFFERIDQYKRHMVLRPVEISNNPEIIRRLGVMAINTALEVDIYGQVNSTHTMGSHLMNGIGGSGDFERNSALSFMVTPSTAKNGLISAIVPMVSHVDHSEHSVDIIVTENGLVDTRNLTPRQTAEAIIKNCSHPDYKDALWDYYQRAVSEWGGHEPHILEEAFSFHTRFMEKGDMHL
jgi:acetyl-CoA hydrolase/succinyl-CoA:acetate CoA-transferase